MHLPLFRSLQSHSFEIILKFCSSNTGCSFPGPQACGCPVIPTQACLHRVRREGPDLGLGNFEKLISPLNCQIGSLSASAWRALVITVIFFLLSHEHAVPHDHWLGILASAVAGATRLSLSDGCRKPIVAHAVTRMQDLGVAQIRVGSSSRTGSAWENGIGGTRTCPHR